MALEVMAEHWVVQLYVYSKSVGRQVVKAIFIHSKEKPGAWVQKFYP